MYSKNPAPTTINEYRPLTLLNADYKLLARLLSDRLRPWLNHILRGSQYCGRQGCTIFDAVATVRDVIANANNTQSPLCIVTIDFQEAFDISHTYLYATLQARGLSTDFQARIKRMYDNARSTVQINGFTSSPIPILSSVRQGCPLSMILFAICLNPLICILEDKLTGIWIAPNGPTANVVAYADDITIFRTSPADIPIRNDALRIYEATSRARVNTRKSKAIAMSRWDSTLQIMGIPYYNEAKILGLHITSTVKASARRCWGILTARIRAQPREAYTRELNLDGRIYYVHTHLMAKAWNLAQIFPPHEASIRRLNTAIAWFIWKGATFRVPLSTLQRSKHDGGWDMIHLKAKCIALLLHRTRIQSQDPETFTAAWLEKWNITEHSPNPPHRGEIPATIDYLRRIYR